MPGPSCLSCYFRRIRLEELPLHPCCRDLPKTHLLVLQNLRRPWLDSKPLQLLHAFLQSRAQDALIYTSLHLRPKPLAAPPSSQNRSELETVPAAISSAKGSCPAVLSRSRPSQACPRIPD